MNPEFFDIEQKKLFGIWPHADLISYGINPYVRRIRQDKIVMAIIGDLLGEDVFCFLESNPTKIAKINVVNKYDDETLRNVFNKNTADYKSKIGFGLDKDKQRDVVCIEKNACTQDNLMLYYNNVKSGGIFCGSGHDTNEVRQTLTEFRRQQKIGTPIQICHRTIWFWYKR